MIFIPNNSLFLLTQEGEPNVQCVYVYDNLITEEEQLDVMSRKSVHIFYSSDCRHVYDSKESRLDDRCCEG